MSKTSMAFVNLRALTILSVVTFHSVLAYLGSQPHVQPPFDALPLTWRAFPIQDSEKWFGFDLFCALLYVFLMPLFFFISGLFVWPSLSRKGIKAFLAGRAYRIGLPFVLGAAILMPVSHYPVYLVNAADPSFGAFLSHWLALPYWAGPLWFLWHLVVLNLATALLFRAAPGLGNFAERLQAKAGESPGRYILGFGAISILAYLPLAMLFKPWDWGQFGPFSLQSAQVLLFVAYFFAGVTAGANGIDRGLLGAENALARGWRFWLGIATAAFFAWLTVTGLAVELKIQTLPMDALTAVLFAISSVTACAAVIALFLRFAARHLAVAGSLANSAYGIYLVHYFFVIWLQYLLLGLPIFPVVKGILVSGGTLFLSWGVVLASRRLPFVAGTSVTRRKAPAVQAAADS